MQRTHRGVALDTVFDENATRRGSNEIVLFVDKLYRLRVTERVCSDCVVALVIFYFHLVCIHPYVSYVQIKNDLCTFLFSLFFFYKLLTNILFLNKGAIDL